MNYASYINNEIFIYFYLSVIFEMFENIGISEMNFGVVGVLCTINCYFEYVYRIRCIFLYIGTCFRYLFENLFSKCPRRMNNFRTNYLFEMFGDVGS